MIIVVLVTESKQLLFTLTEQDLKLSLKLYSFKEYSKVLIIRNGLKIVWNNSHRRGERNDK